MATAMIMKNSRIDHLFDYPFQKLATLLAGTTPRANLKPLLMHLGEPQLPQPPVVAATLSENQQLWNRYPSARGTAEFRDAAAGWLVRRYNLPAGMLEPARNLLPLPGTKEGIFQLAQLAVPGPEDWIDGQRPAVLMSNPTYHVYKGAAIMTGAEPIYVPATAGNNFLPDFEGVGKDVLDRTALVYLCNPSNPQGTVADRDYLARLIALARRHDFIIAFDECYTEIYRGEPPAGALEICAAMDGALNNVTVFHSLSKRSSGAGLRSGFVVGDPDLIDAFAMLRSTGGAVVPLPILAASAALWRDDAHANETRTHYVALFDMAERILGNRTGFYKPPAGFFLWLDVGDGEAAARDLWRDLAVKTIPGAYFSYPDPATGENPGKSYIRVALVHDLDDAEEGLTRIAEYLGA
jgi:N-succinyldiaminopimelate aminotransferase